MSSSRFPAVVVCAVALFCPVCPRVSVVEVTGKTDLVLGVEGGSVNLPCDVSPPSRSDEVALILWYKDESTTPLYSLDSRRRGLHQAKHAPSPDIAERARVIVSHSPSFLRIEGLRSDDEGEYRCRVDFRVARSRNILVVLEIITPPKTPVIKNRNGEMLYRFIGPYDLGYSLILICEVEGGKPLPSLTWWKDSALLDDTYQVPHRGLVRNDLVVPSLQRHDLHSVLTCHASNNNISVPTSVSITIDMNLPPLEADIENKNRPLSANKAVELICRIGGSRPPANITWTLGQNLLKGRKVKVSSEGNITIGRINFIPRITDRGKNISCRAENAIFPGAAVVDEWQIDVHYVPQPAVRLGSKLRHSHIQEGKDVYLDCSILANPPATGVGWRYENHELHTNKSSGVIVSGQSLVLQQVKRTNRGRYTCTAENAEGRGESIPFYLRVQYAPTCGYNQNVLYGVARNEVVNVSCEVDADPATSNFTWKFNNSAESVDLMTFLSEEGRSTATYTPKSEFDYGTLLCWGRNSVGMQKEPCVFTIIPAGSPDPVRSCIVTNQTEQSLIVRCLEGYDGGLRQHFLLEIYDAQRIQLHSNISNIVPVFAIYDLHSGLSFTIVVYALNAKGRSLGVTFKAATLSIPESQTQKDDTWTFSFSPILIILTCVVMGLVLAALSIVLALKTKKQRRKKEKAEQQKHVNDKSASSIDRDSDDPREVTGTVIESEDKCPDVIPGVDTKTEPTKLGDFQKPDIYKDDVCRESKSDLKTKQSFNSSDYDAESWGIREHPLVRQMSSEVAPQMTSKDFPLQDIPAMRDYLEQPESLPQSSDFLEENAGRADWTLPRAAIKTKHKQTDV